MANKKVVVAFSGGLDTSYTVMKLTQDGWDVYADGPSIFLILSITS